MTVPYAAYLRVYQPLVAFCEQERHRWEDYVATGSPPDRATGPDLERRMALAALLARPSAPVIAAAQEQAFVRVVDGTTYLCPWRTRERSWAALREFSTTMPEEIIAAFLPAGAVEAAERELDRARVTAPDLLVPVRCSRWHVPLCWFVLVEAGERQLVLGRRPAVRAGARRGSERDPRSLRYLTHMSRARRRAAWALGVLRRAAVGGPVVAGVAELAHWIEGFHPRSLLELDYGGLVHLVEDDALRQDDSAAAVGAALTGLAAGNTAAATAAYQDVSRRWHDAQLMESTN